MNLLDENIDEKPKNIKGKKTILSLIIISLVLLVIIAGIMIYLVLNREIPDQLKINGNLCTTSNDVILTDTQGNKYISIKDLVETLGYEYFSSGYNEDGIGTTKCYVKNDSLIFGFEQDTNTMYKCEEDTILDYQYYDLNYNIITYNNKLYISVYDIPKALNVSCSIDSNNVISVETMEYTMENYKEKLKEKGYTIDESKNNQKAIAYGWLIVKNSANIYGVLDKNLNVVIDEKYSYMYFDEYNQNYIVANTSGKYGIINTKGGVVQTLKYDDLQLINYENMLYKVKNGNLYGVMKKDGTLLTNIEYEDIGYNANKSEKILYTLIISLQFAEGDKFDTIVVKQNGKYGLIRLANGNIFLPCDHLEKLYSKSELGKTVYKAQFIDDNKSVTYELEEYLKIRGTNIMILN